METDLSEYIDLGRRFRPCSEKQSSGEDVVRSYSSFWDRYHTKAWPDLFAQSAVHIVLGEPGSGRTYEFKARARALFLEGKDAFFLSLHRLVTSPPEQTMDAEDRSRFAAWLESEREGWFFLDAVDESKLERVSDFRQALNGLSAVIGPATARSRIFISSRIKDWLWPTDVRHVVEAFGLKVNKEDDPSPVEEGGEEKGGWGGGHPLVHVWTIAPLDEIQIRRYLDGLHIRNADTFVAALDDAYAWEFAARPLDVNLLADYWQKHQRIGFPAEMLEHCITEQLKERPQRAEFERLFPLDSGKARRGAETLAAAVIFCRRLDFRIADDSADGPQGLDPQACLPDDWKPTEVHALLSRRLFDAAIYGCTRFHHRSFTEYLAASWLNRLLGLQCPEEEVVDQLFAVSRAATVVRQSRVALAVWLACIGDGIWRDGIQQRLLEAAPEAFLRYGDPARLSDDFKRQILDALVKRYGNREVVRFDTSEAALRRMSDPSYCEKLVSLLMSSEVSAALKDELVDLARVARVQAAVPAVLALLCQPDLVRPRMTNALRLISDLGSCEQKDQTTGWLGALPSISCGILGPALKMFYPQHLSPDTVGTLIRKLSDPEAAESQLSRWMERCFATVNEIPAAAATLASLIPLVEQEPHFRGTRLSSGYAWLLPALRPLLRRLLRAETLDGTQCDVAARALFLMTQDLLRDDFGIVNQEEERGQWDVDKLTRNHPQVRRQTFWRHFQEQCERREHRDAANAASWVLDYTLRISSLTPEDFEWAVHDLAAGRADESRLGAYLLALRYGFSRRPFDRRMRRIRSAIQDSRQLKERLASDMRFRPFAGVLCWCRRQRHFRMRAKFMWLHRKRRLNTARLKVQDWLWLRWNLKAIARGEKPFALLNLVHLNLDKDESRWAQESWKKLTDLHGRRVTKAVQDGCEAVWATCDPVVNSDSEPHLVAGLVGVHIQWRSGRMDFAKLSAAEAGRGTHFALAEMNGLSPWLHQLAKHHPGAVSHVIDLRIADEWNSAHPVLGVPLIGRLMGAHSTLRTLLAPMVFSRLKLGDPSNAEGLSQVIRFLIRNSVIRPREISGLAALRIRNYRWDDPCGRLWMFVWLQTDSSSALDHFEGLLAHGTITPEQATGLAVMLCNSLENRHNREGLLEELDFLRPAKAPRFIRWVYRWVNRETDVHHVGSHTVTPRDDAQMFRGSLFRLLADQSTAEAEAALGLLSRVEEFSGDRDYILSLLDDLSRRLADGVTWSEHQIRQFESQLLSVPTTLAELFGVARRRLNQIKSMVERPFDTTPSDGFRAGDNEDVLRRLLSEKLSSLSGGVYTVPQEAVINGELRPDLRIERPSVGSVPIEVKIAGSRGLNSLIGDLEGQLVGDYLSSHRNRYGLFVVGIADKPTKNWDHPETGEPWDFPQMIQYLQNHASRLLQNPGEVLGLEVIGIDFRPRISARAQSRKRRARNSNDVSDDQAGD